MTPPLSHPLTTPPKNTPARPLTRYFQPPTEQYTVGWGILDKYGGSCAKYCEGTPLAHACARARAPCLLCPMPVPVPDPVPMHMPMHNAHAHAVPNPNQAPRGTGGRPRTSRDSRSASPSARATTCRVP